MVDAASTEGRDPIIDIHTIHTELAAYSEDLAKLPQVIAANKTDVFYGTEEETVLTLMKEEFEPKGIPVFPISAVSGKGVKELLFYVNERLKELDTEPSIFEKEFFPEETQERQEPIVVERVEDGVFSVTGARVERMLGYTNLDSEKGFEFFQRFLKDNGILDKLEELGVEEGDTVVLYDLSFEYYK